MELVVEKGMGYVPVEQRDSSELEIGMIAIDSVFTPVLAVGYEVKNIRVGKRTDFDQLQMKIKTDGTLSPVEALAKSAKILIDQFDVFSDVKKIDQLIKEKEKLQKAEKELAEKKEEEEADDISISELNFSTRTFNALDNAKIRKLNDLAKKDADTLLKLSGFGQTALNEVEKALKKHDMELKKD
jgi:DNA-directed RNA polymerase subunit alpha